MEITHDEAIEYIWNFFERCSNIMAKDFETDTSPMHIKDLRMVDYGTKDTKNGKIKTVKAIREIPFRTVDFFGNHFTDVKNAYKFFNPANKQEGIRIVTEKYFKPLNRFNTNDFIGEGLISHRVACDSLPWHSEGGSINYNGN